MFWRGTEGLQTRRWRRQDSNSLGPTSYCGRIFNSASVVPRFGYLIGAPVDAALLSNLPPGGGNVMIRPPAVPNDSWITNG